MTTKTIQLYKFEELSEDIQENVISNFRNNDEFFYGEEYVKTIKAFCKHFDLKLNDYTLGSYSGSDHITIDKDYLPGTKGLLKVSKEWIDTCPLTGCCYDYDILLPLLNMKGLSVEEILENCFQSIIEAYQKELDYWYSKESILGDIEANEYTFRENGTMENI